jgi:hypothetical protein
MANAGSNALEGKLLVHERDIEIVKVMATHRQPKDEPSPAQESPVGIAARD